MMSIIASSYKLGQLIEDDEYYIVATNLVSIEDIASSYKLGQLVEAIATNLVR